MKVFNTLIVILEVISLIIFFYFFDEMNTAEVDPYSDGQAGIGVAILFIYSFWVFLTAIAFMFIHLMVVLIARKWSDRFSRITLFMAIIVSITEFFVLLALFRI